MASSNYSIVVTVNGQSGRRSNNGIDPDRVAAGEYDVNFPESVRDWIWLATIAPTDDTPQEPSFITVERSTMTDETLHVRTSDKAGNAANRAFHLHVRRLQT